MSHQPVDPALPRNLGRRRQASRSSRAGRWLLVAVSVSMGAGSVEPHAQQTACAITGATPAAAALPAGCGSATLGISPAQRRLGPLVLTVQGAAVYVRTIRLGYGGTPTAPVHQIDMRLHRLFLDDERTPPMAVSHAGLGLTSVAVDISPPSAGTPPVRVVVIGAGDGNVPVGPSLSPQTTGTLAPTAAPVPAPVTTEVLDASEWALVGSTFAHLAQLRDILPIGRAKGRFDRLALSSRGNDLPLQSIQVLPVNGPPFAVDLRTVLAPGMLSGPIAVDPPDFIREVVVTYATSLPQARVPVVEVRGHYAENWLGKIGENRQFAGGWVLLGTVDVVVSPHSTQRRGIYQIGGQAGPFKRLRLVSRRGAVDVAGLTVDSGDGRSENISVNRVLLPDTEAPPLPFDGGPQPVAKVVVIPRLNPQSRIDATVEVWGQY